MTQGRKFGIRLIGITQDYVSNDSYAIDVMKQAGTQIFFEPAKSQERIAKELEYKDAADAGLGSMGIGECIVSSELFNTKDGCNTKAIISCSTLRFTDPPLYERFRREYQIADPPANADESEASQPEEADDLVEEALSEGQELISKPLLPSAPEEMDVESSKMKKQMPQSPEAVDDVPTEETLHKETMTKVQELSSTALTSPPPDEMDFKPSAEKEQIPQPPETINSEPESAELPTSESAATETAEAIAEPEKSPMPPESETVTHEDAEQERIEHELQEQVDRAALAKQLLAEAGRPRKCKVVYFLSSSADLTGA